MDMSILYFFFIVFVIVAASNAVNLTDGLDGLAIVPSIFVALVFGIFAYVIGHATFSAYLQYEQLKGSGELVIFCATILGAGMGFLWYNSYPAQVFMGDIGSMTLGGIFGTIAVLIKQELLFVIVGGIFVIEAFTTLLQKYIFIKYIGRRLFLRTPLHHTYQVRGIAEPKVVVRFWIISAILALISLSALKLR